jgi:uncharacterized protein YdaU (DUF1376 family)
MSDVLALLTPTTPTAFIDQQLAEYAIDARRCKAITSKMSGRTYYRTEDPSMRWHELYRRAAQNTNEFEVEMEPMEEAFFEVEGDEGKEQHPRLTADQLKAMTMTKIREIGKLYNVISNRKEILIQGILAKQADNIQRAKGV